MPQVFAAPSPTSISEQVQLLGDGGTPGTLVNPKLDSNGQPTKLGFFGATPAAQASGNIFNPAVRGGQTGLVMTFASVQTPSSVLTLTTAEQSFTVQSGTGATLTPLATDVFVINKPTAQAGLGVGNIRYSSGGVIGVTFNNLTAGTLTPTGAEIYGIVGIRSMDSLTSVLTPAAVASHSTGEQIFTVNGVRINTVVAASKPTTQAGLDIVGARIAGDNQIGITFMNVTGAVLTPTAAETYTFYNSGGVDPVADVYTLQVNSTLTPATILTVSTAEITLTSANVQATDWMVGVQKPTFQAGLLTGQGRVSGASTLKVSFGNPTGGNLTPTASEDYLITMGRPALAAPVTIYTATLTPLSVAANTTAEQTFAVTGVVSGSVVTVNKPSATPGLGIVGARVASAGNVAINFCNPTGAAITPPSEAYIFSNVTALIDTTAGNVMSQVGVNTDSSLDRLANGMQAALGPSGYGLFTSG